MHGGRFAKRQDPSQSNQPKQIYYGGNRTAHADGHPHELEKPSRDPREQLEEFHFAESVHTIDDLQVGMVLPGIVTNISNFGAFVDLGVHKDGLIHISEMANRRITDPAQVVSIHQHVQVRVIAIDRERSRIQLSLKQV